MVGQKVEKGKKCKKKTRDHNKGVAPRCADSRNKEGNTAAPISVSSMHSLSSPQEGKLESYSLVNFQNS